MGNPGILRIIFGIPIGIHVDREFPVDTHDTEDTHATARSPWTPLGNLLNSLAWRVRSDGGLILP